MQNFVLERLCSKINLWNIYKKILLGKDITVKKRAYLFDSEEEKGKINWWRKENSSQEDF